MQRILVLAVALIALTASALPARAQLTNATAVAAEASEPTLAEARSATQSKSVVEREWGYAHIQRLTGHDERPPGHAEALREHFGNLKGILADAIAKGTLEEALSASQQAAIMGWEDVSSAGMDRMREAVSSAIQHGVPSRDAVTILSAVRQAEQLGLPLPDDSKLRQQYDDVVSGWDEAGDDPPDGDEGGGSSDDPPPDSSAPPDVPTGSGDGDDDSDGWTLVHTSSGSEDGHSFRTDTYKNEDGVYKDVTTWTDPQGTSTTTTTCYTTAGTQQCPQGRPAEDDISCPVCDWALSLLGGDPYAHDPGRCAEEACPEFGYAGGEAVEPDIDGDGTPDVEDPGYVDPLPDAAVMELDAGVWNPCEQACPEADPRDPSIGDLGPPTPVGDPLPITPYP